MSSALGGPPADRRIPYLSPREREVLRVWLASDSKEIAAKQLFVAPSTVNTHISRIRGKYEALDRPAPSKTQLLIRALQDGLATIEDIEPGYTSDSGRVEKPLAG